MHSVNCLLFFSSSFCSIYWVKKGGAKFRLRGLVESNDAISADEGLHVVFAAVLYMKLKYYAYGISPARAAEIMRSAVECEEAFVREALPEPIMGMNAGMMCRYVRYVADTLMMKLRTQNLKQDAIAPQILHFSFSATM